MDMRGTARNGEWDETETVRGRGEILEDVVTEGGLRVGSMASPAPMRIQVNRTSLMDGVREQAGKSAAASNVLLLLASLPFQSCKTIDTSRKRQRN